MAPPSTVKKLTMFSALPLQALLSHLDSGFIAHPTDRKVLQDLWEKTNKLYSTSGSPKRSFLTSNDLRELDGVDQTKVENLMKRVKTYSPYDVHTTKIYNVRISKLVSPQIALNLPRAEKRATIKKGMSTSELFDLAFKSAGQPASITRQVMGMGSEGGNLLFSSYDEDVRFHFPPQYRTIPLNEMDPQSPSLESVCHPIGGGNPFGAVYRMEVDLGASRLILANGIHRIYNLAKAGYEWCPLLVCDLMPFVLPEPFIDLPKDILLNPNSDPAVVTDFLNDQVVIPLDYHKLLKTIRLNWNFEEYFTVLK